MDQRHILSVKNVHKKFAQGLQSIAVINGISVTFVQGESYAIMGISGSGKSTFVQLLAGLDTPTSGSIYFDHEVIEKFSAQQQDHFRNQKIGLVFQQAYLIQELSVIENIGLPGLIAGESRSVACARAKELLMVVGLSEFGLLQPQVLSGGQQQRVVLARALYNRPAFLIADEPTGSLDKGTGMAIIDLLHQCQQEWGMGLIISTHDAYVAQRMAHRYEMINGLLHVQH